MSFWDASMFPSRVDLLDVTEGQGSIGAPKTTTTVKATALPCSIQRLDPQDAAAMTLVIQSGVDTLVYFPADPTAKVNDRLRDTRTGQIYRVVGTTNQVDRDLLWTIHARAVTTTI